MSKGLTITESEVEGGVYARGPMSWASDLIAGTEMSPETQNVSRDPVLGSRSNNRGPEVLPGSWRFL